ncbi:Uncharacterized protein TCM_041780 [Theobroma cacao]|uniref:Uncharacterized protein n=1 Tax=Theobroma cacao TaxID=3641 RepID=A0A061H007_THECC|nr:Uncharacterized protein TCM_041780 [Theobroma cacao]
MALVKPICCCSNKFPPSSIVEMKRRVLSSVPWSPFFHVGTTNSSVSGNGYGDKVTGDSKGIAAGEVPPEVPKRRVPAAAVFIRSSLRDAGACFCSLVGGFPTLVLVMPINCFSNMFPPSSILDMKPPGNFQQKRLSLSLFYLSQHPKPSMV